MTTGKVVLAETTLTEKELQAFAADFQHSNISKFTEVKRTALEGGWVEVNVYSGEQLPDNVIKNMLRESLTRNNGEFAQCYWRKVVQIAD